ncbi:MAG: secretin N-terminal domain-containing protein [Planctomycetota bacterium]
MLRLEFTDKMMRGLVALSCFVVILSTSVVSARQPTQNSRPKPAAPKKLSRGVLPVRDFARYVYLIGDRWLNFPSEPAELSYIDASEINLLTDIEELSDGLLDAVLEVNGFYVWETRLFEGTPVYYLRVSQRWNTPIPTRKFRPAPRIPALKPVTNVFRLQHATSYKLAAALRSLRGSASSDAASMIFNLAHPDARTLVLAVNSDLAVHYDALVKSLDVPANSGAHAIEVRALRHENASHLAQLLRPLIESIVAPGEGELPMLIADDKLQKLVICTDNPTHMSVMHGLIDQLDVESAVSRGTTKIYRAQHLPAAELEAAINQVIQVTEAVNESGADAVLDGATRWSGVQIIAHEQTNSLLMRGSTEEIENLFRVLPALDRPRSDVELMGRRVARLELRHLSTRVAVDALRKVIAADERAIEPASDRTHVVEDAQNGRILISYSEPDRYKKYRELLAKIDVPPADRAPKEELQTWVCQHRVVDEVIAAVRESWKDPQLPLVAMQTNNTLLVRVAPNAWPELRALIEKIDAPRAN